MRGEPWNVRQEYEGRPSVFVLLGLIVGLTSLTHPINLLALLGLFWLRSLNGRSWCAVFFVIGLVLAPMPSKPMEGRHFVVTTGTVSGAVRRDGAQQTCLLDVREGTYKLRLFDGPALTMGDRVRVRGIATGASHSEQRLGSLLTIGELQSRRGDVMNFGALSPLFGVVRPIRDSFEQSTSQSFGPEAASTVNASVLGIDDIPPELASKFRDSGAVSLCSVSGLQILLMAGILGVLLQRFPIPRPVQIGLVGACILAYAAANGLHAGVVRASILTLLLMSAYLFRREPDLLSALALSAAGELIWRPTWVFDFGFQLSFIVVTVLALWLPNRSRVVARNLSTRILYGFCSIAAMFFAAMPLIAYQSGELNFAAPFAGTLIVPAIPPMFLAALLGWLLTLLSPMAGGLWMKAIVGPFAGWVLTISDLSGRLEPFKLGIPPFSAYLLAPVYVLIALGARFTSRAFSGVTSRGGTS